MSGDPKTSPLVGEYLGAGSDGPLTTVARSVKQAPTAHFWEDSLIGNSTRLWLSSDVSSSLTPPSRM